MATVQKVEIEIWDKQQRRIADITEIARNRFMTLKRNGIGVFQFSLDLKTFTDFCDGIGTHPREILYPYICDIIVKLDGQYWQGFECSYVVPYLNQSDQTLSVRALSYLGMFEQRFTSESFSNVESTAIASGIITAAQAELDGDFGFTIGSQYTTGVTRVRNYERTRISDALIDLTQLETGTFDFEFTYDKVFKTYEQIGTLREDVPLRYGIGGNIKNTDAAIDGPALANYITAIGSGFGADQVTATAIDRYSALAYGKREELPLFNSVEDEDELQENADGFLARTKDLLQIPAVVVPAHEINLLASSVGDRFHVDLTEHKYTDNVNGWYRVEQMDIDWDENDAADVTLTFDDNGVDQNEAA